jgi:aspartate carbamoyltransferase catalytic subunit
MTDDTAKSSEIGVRSSEDSSFRWKRKDLLSVEELSREEIVHILKTAESFKEVSSREVKKVPALRGKTIANLFFESSTRTRTSFELAAKRLSADTVNFSSSGSSTSKGESLRDTAKNIEAMQIDTIVMRHSSSGSAEYLARSSKAGVINAGDGIHEHPTQGLLDMFTIQERKKKIEGLKVCLVGDILHSRVARSNIWGLKKMGAKVTVCGPPTLIPKSIEKLGVEVSYDLDKVIREQDVLNILRIQLERQQGAFFPSLREYAAEYGISNERMKKAKEDVMIMHPGPINRGVELSGEVADGPQSVILNQVTNGVAVRMAVLFLTTLVERQ